ncbi:glycosyltransferase [Sporomusa sp. GT1]|uniref:glycosyltransferase n=1 Tax=Sporomusa sp. GT1 TaxID=1534747 RepID=UPI00166E830B|nr:glycosyltransferase [Sporomusa sp. GT1]
MKILYLTPYYPYPPVSGGVRCILERMKMLNNAGFCLDLVGITNRELTKEDTDCLKPYVNSIDYHKRQAGLILAWKAAFSLVAGKSLFLSLISKNFYKVVSELLKKNIYDAVLCEHTYLAYWFLQKFPKHESKMITVVHNIEFDWYNHMYIKEKNLIKKLYYFIEKQAFKKNEDILFSSKSKFLFLSSSELLCISKKYSISSQSLIIPALPIAPKKSPYNHFERQPIILFVGRLDSPRNTDAIKYFINEILAKLVLKLPEVKLRIVGRGDDGTFSKFVLNSPYRHNISFQGAVDDLDSEYNNAKIVIVPIHESIGVQTKLFEAINYSSLIVCTPAAVKGTIFSQENGVFIGETDEIFLETCAKIITNTLDINSKLNEITDIFNRYNSFVYIESLKKFLTN